MTQEEFSLTGERRTTYAGYRGNTMPADTEVQKNTQEEVSQNRDGESPKYSEQRVRADEQEQQAKPRITAEQWLQKVEARMEALQQQRGNTINGKTLGTRDIRTIVADMPIQDVEEMLREIMSIQKTQGQVSKKVAEEVTLYQRELQEVVAEERQKEFASQKASLDSQLANEWMQAVAGESVVFEQQDVKTVTIQEKNGKQVIVMPQKPTLADVIKAAELLGHVDSTDIKTATSGKIYSFAKQLKDAAGLLSKQKDSKGNSIFDAGVIEYLYNYGEHLRALSQGEKSIESKNRDQIEVGAGELLPEFYESHPDEKKMLQSDKRMLQSVEEDYADKLFLFLLGKENRSVTLGEVESFYYQLYQRRQADYTPETYDTWLLGHKKIVMRLLSHYVNDGKFSDNARLGEGLQKGTKEAVSETLFEAVSQKGQERQRFILSHLPGVSPETLGIVNREIDLRQDTTDLLAEGRKLVEGLKDKPLSEQIEALNNLVLKTYGLEDINSPYPNYFPMEALQKGEFGCSIQALVMRHMLREVYGDDLILMADTFIAGPEGKTGHIRLIAIPKNGDVSKAISVDTVVNGEKTKRKTYIQPVENSDIVAKALSAYKLDQSNFHITGDIDDINAIDDGKHHNIGNADKLIESAIWNNMAATADNIDQQQRKAMLERSLMLDPYNATAWAQLAAQYKPGSSEHNAFLQKAKALNIDVENLQMDQYTIDAYEASENFANGDRLITGNAQLDQYLSLLNSQLDDLTRTSGVTANPSELPTRQLEGYRQAIENIRLNNAGDPNVVHDADIILKDLNKAIDLSQQTSEGSIFSVYSQLPDVEKRAIMRDPEAWLQGQFDKLYQTVRSGQVLDSTQFQVLQQRFSEASTAVGNRFGDSDPKLVKRFNAIFNLRLYAILGRTTAEARQVKEIGQAVQKMGGIDGIFEAMSLDDNRVQSMYQLIASKLDAERLAHGGPEKRLLPDVIYDLQEQITEEALHAGVHSTAVAKHVGAGEYGKYEAGSRYVAGVGEYAEVYQRILGEIRDVDKPRDQLRVRDVLTHLEEGYRRDYKDAHPGTTDVTIPEAIREELKQRAEEHVAMERTKQDITRSVRLAYDLVVVTARDAVIASRGEPPAQDLQRFRSDPTGLNAYNLEALTISKFNILNHEEVEYLDYLKTQLATNELHYKKGMSLRAISKMDKKELVKIGTILFKDMFAVPDFYSSGWRILGVLEALGERVGEVKAENLALFMQLRLGENHWSHDENDPYRKGKPFRIKTWNKIADYYPEEIVKIFREKMGGEKLRGGHGHGAHGEDHAPLDPKFAELMMNSIFAPSAGDPPYDPHDPTLRSEAQYRYDLFRKKYDGVLNHIRQENLQSPSFSQVDWQHLTAGQRNYINGYLGDTEAASRLQTAMRLMTDFAKAGPDGREVKLDPSKTSRAIGMLLDDAIFSDVYTRTLRVDDVPFTILQDANKRMMGKAPVGAKLGSQPGNDALIRSWNDTNTAMEAAVELLKLLSDGPMGKKGIEHKIEQAEKFAAKVDGYNGVDAGAEVMRATVGSLLLATEPNFLLDALGIEHLPFNIPTNKLQKIFGPGAGVMSRREVKALMYSLREKLTKTGHDKEEAEKIVQQLMKRLGIDAAGTIKLQGIAALIIGIIGLFSTMLELVDFKGQLKAAA